MVAAQAQNPFEAGQRSRRLRTIIFISAGILLVLGLILLYTSSRRSTILIAGPNNQYTISLNGQPVNTQTTSKGTVIPVYSGLYRLKIERPNYLPFQSDIQVNPGKQVSVRPTFTMLPSEAQTAQSGISYVRPSPDEHSLYYLGDARQRLYRMEVATQTHIQLTDKPLTAVTDVEWSSNPDVTLLTQQDGAYLLEIPKFDFNNQTLVKVAGPEVVSPMWDPTNPDRLAAAYFTAGGEKSLVIADKRFTQIDRKEDLKDFSNPKLVWSPDGRYIAVINRSSNYPANDLWIYDTTTATFDKVTSSGNILDAKFNPDSTVIALERLTQGNDYQLAAYTIAAKQEAVLPTSARLAQTAWKDNSSLYIPGPNGDLVLLNLDGSQTNPGYSFPQGLNVKGMWYFAKSGSLVFYTENAVYTVTLDS